MSIIALQQNISWRGVNTDYAALAGCNIKHHAAITPSD